MRYNCRLLFIIALKHEGISFHSRFVLEYFGFGLGLIHIVFGSSCESTKITLTGSSRVSTWVEMEFSGSNRVRRTLSVTWWKHAWLHIVVGNISGLIRTSLLSPKVLKKSAHYTLIWYFFLNRPHIFNTYFFSWSRKRQ